jgi:hypothetical protein
LYFGFLSTLSGNGPWIPAGEGVAVLEFEVCLRAGATAGEYPLELTGGELIDAGSGRAIAPDLVSGTLVLAADLDPGVGAEVGWTDCYPPVIDGPEDVNARFEVGGGTAVPGETVTLPFIIRANDDVQGYSVSLDFDEEVIEAVGVDTVFEKPDGSEYGFVFHEFDNANATPGSGGVDEGFFIGAAVFSLEDNRNLMPRDQDNTALALTVRVKPETEASSTEFRILDGAQGSGDAVPNAVTIRGMTVIPENAGSFVLIDGVLNVLPEITAFIRGDSNGDQVLNITDPQATLSYLFRGARRPACYDAADANDDGELNIVDPIATLMHLFAGAGNLPAPFPAAGEDPTGDRLRCSSIVSE